MKSNQNDIFTRLIKIYKEFSVARRIDSDSQMCEFWEDPTVEILIDSDELNALEIEFGIEFNDDTAMELYDMTLKDAAIFIENMIQEKNNNGNVHNSEIYVDEVTPEKAKRILLELWQNNYKVRKDIIAAIEKIDYENKSEKKA